MNLGFISTQKQEFRIEAFGKVSKVVAALDQTNRHIFRVMGSFMVQG